MLSIRDLEVSFSVDQHSVEAVKGVSFEVKAGQTLGIVGESGSGKSVTAMSILGLLPNTATVTGEILWKDRDVLQMSPTELRQVRGGEIGYVFQNPLAALNPVFSVANQMIETIQCHSDASKEQAREEAIALLETVHITDARIRIDDYPHQFSLGMCQRIMIAMTLSMKPDLLIADEPTASLDVTTQKEILELMDDLQKTYNMAMIVISHDLAIIAQRCDSVSVMYLGEVVEEGAPKRLFSSPKQAYTKSLIEAIPRVDF